MSNFRPFRFGVTTHLAATKAAWMAKAQRAEQLGYSVLILPDHLGDQLAPGIAMALAAEATQTLRISSCVFNNDFRHPVMLAKEAATLDFLSGGRFELGLGAGWQQVDYERVGIPFDPAGVRISRLEESVHLIKKLFTEETTAFSGTYYHVTDYHALPKPLQRPYPPIMLSGGSKRMLSLAAREADIITINPAVKADGNTVEMRDAIPEITGRKIDWIREAAGERFAAIELNILVFEVVITEQVPHDANTKVTGVAADITGGQALQGMYVFVGSVDQICEQVLANRERFGISYISVFEKDMEKFAPVVARLAGK